MTKEYRVLDLSVTSGAPEVQLNRLAKQGWRLHTATARGVWNVIYILEREAPQDEPTPTPQDKTRAFNE